MWRGKVAAWLSGAAKSRHFRHDVGIDVACGFGFVARILDKSGRDSWVTGGAVGLGSLPFITLLAVG